MPPSVANGGGTTQLTFNRDHQVTLALRPDGTQVTYNYDSAGRLSSVAAPSGPQGFTYDTSGSIASATASEVTLAYTRDGILPKTIAWTGAVNGSIAVTYDNNLRPASKTVAGGTSVAFVYDDDGLVTKVGAESIIRDAANGRTTGTAAGVVADSVSYDSFGLVSDYAATISGTPLVGFHYTRDAAGRITSITETTGNSASSTRSFTYDTAGRLTNVTQDGSAVASYTFDQNSNRLTRATPSGTETGTYDDQDRLLTYAGTTFTYTPNGEIATKTSSAGVTGYGYDSFGNLTSVTLPDGRVIEYVLDARGRRVAKKVNGAVVAKFLYENGLRPIAQLAPDDSVVEQFVYGERGNTPSLILRGGVTYRVISDHLGSPRYLIDTATGSIADSLGYDEFGVEFEASPGLQPFGYGGGLYDADTMRVHFGAREYDPTLGRFLSKDPIGLAGGLNTYDYATNDPVNFADPTGLLFGGAINAGEAYGQEAVDGYADTLADPSAGTAAKVGAAVGGFFAALWTPCTSDKTFTTLSIAYGANQWVGRSFWQYTSGNPAYRSPYLTRGLGWAPPYEPGLEAAERLALPSYNPAITVHEVPNSFSFFAGGPAEVAPNFGHLGGGTEYFIGGWPP